MKGDVLITDGDQRAALAIVRSLGAAGYRCTVAAPRPRSLAGVSRYAYREVVVGDATGAPGAYADAVEALVTDGDFDLVIPVTEPSLLALLPLRERLPAAIPFPDVDTFRAICDKGRVLEAARELGIRTPRQQEIRSPHGGQALRLELPVVLKPARSVYSAPDGTLGKTSVAWARSAEAVGAALESYPPAAFPVLAQEVIAGPGIGVFVLVHDGRLLASFAHRRIREKPPSGGVSVVRQSEPMDPELLDRSLALLSRFGWSGVAMVEYKVDERTGEAVLMEVNGRFWGSLQLAIDAGVDFPRILADAALGRPVEPVTGYRMVRTRWFWGDTDHLLAVWRDSNGSGSGKLSTLLAWVRAFAPGVRTEVFRWTDIRPFLRETRQWWRQVL